MRILRIVVVSVLLVAMFLAGMLVGGQTEGCEDFVELMKYVEGGAA